jgi:hypothetical protein
MSQRRTVVYVIGLGFLFLLLILTAYLGKSYSGGTAQKNSWTRENEILLASMPVYPGATEARAPYTTGETDPNATTKTKDGGPYRGYWTTNTYTLPLGVRPDLVLAFYRERLAGWAPASVQGSSCEITFSRDHAMLDLKACDDQLALSVNYKEIE